jgi:hypothetical protein
MSALVLYRANVRVRSRLVASSRDWSYLVDVGDVALDGVGSHKIFFASLGLHLVTVELCEGAIFLDSTDRSGKSGGSKQLGRLLNSEGVLMVGRTCASVRVRSLSVPPSATAIIFELFIAVPARAWI